MQVIIGKNQGKNHAQRKKATPTRTRAGVFLSERGGSDDSPELLLQPFVGVQLHIGPFHALLEVVRLAHQLIVADADGEAVGGLNVVAGLGELASHNPGELLQGICVSGVDNQNELVAPRSARGRRGDAARRCCA